MIGWSVHIVLAVAALTGTISVASGQTAPNAAELSAYQGLHAAAARGDPAAILARSWSPVELERRDGQGRTAVHVAAHGSHYEAVRALAKAGVDVRAKDSRAYDVITIAAVKDDVAMVRLAIELGADAKAITSPYDGTALIAAAHLGHAEVVKVLCGAGAPLDHVNNLGWTAAIEVVVLGDGGRRHQETLQALVDAGANMAIGDRDGVTPLAHARRRGFTAMIEMLGKGRR